MKGIPESPNEKWDTTKKILASNLSKLCKMEETDVVTYIERAHRGKQTKDKKKDGKRDIHVLFYDWNDSQHILSQFLEHGRGQNIFIEQRYGPETTFRQNKAKEERRNLKGANAIHSGYVKFPAQLMVKYTKNDAKYTLHKDFSRIEVDILPSNHF